MIDIVNKYQASPSFSLSGCPEDLSSLFYTAWQCLGEPQDAGPIGERLFTDETCLNNRALDAVRLRALSILACKNPYERVNLKLQLWLENSHRGEKREEAAGLLRDYLCSPKTDLCLAGLGLTSLPDIFDEEGFAELAYLDVDGNQLFSLPETIGQLSKLETLVVTGNCLTELPESLGCCRELRYLLCGYNQMTSIPAEVVSLIPEMFIVDFAFNRLTSLPPGKAQTQTSYESNPIPEIVLQAMMRGLAEIHDFPGLPFKDVHSLRNVCWDTPCGERLFHSVWVDAGSPPDTDPQYGEKAFLGKEGFPMSNVKRIKVLQEVLAPYVRANPGIFNISLSKIEQIMPLQAFFPSLKIIGKEEWENCLADRGGLKACGLSIDKGEIPSHDKIIPILRQLFQHAIEGNGGVTLFILPEGLSLKKLEDFFPRKLRYAYRGAKSMFSDVAVEKSGWRVITNGIFEGTRNKTEEEQRRIVQEKGCTFPELLSVTALCLLTEKLSSPPLHLFGDGTFTRCQERAPSSLCGPFVSSSVGPPITVGGFQVSRRPTGELVSPEIFLLSISTSLFGGSDHKVGAAGVIALEF